MKNNKDNKILTTLKEIQDWAFAMMAKDDFFIYRGQGDSAWNLNSVFTRKDKDSFFGQKQKHFSYIKEYFMAKNKFLKKELESSDDLSLLGNMQHHGQLTPLIDFTEDIFVALWFGASFFDEMENNSEREKCFRIFYLKRKEEEYSAKLDIEKIEMNQISAFKFNTGQKIGRSISQKSIFIFDNLNLDKEISYIDIKYDFDLKIEIISWLKKLGITSNSLFPDTEGMFKNFDFLSPQHFFMNGLKMISLKRFESAAKEFEKVIKLNPFLDDAYNNWGSCLKDLGKYDEAIEKYKKAIILNSKNLYAYFNWGESLDYQGKYDEAIDKYQKALKIDPYDTNSYVNWGVSLKQQGKYDEAIEKYKKAMVINPNNVLIYSNWGLSLREQGKYDEAIEKYEKALKIDPSNLIVYLNLGTVLCYIKKYDEAIEIFKIVTKIDHNDTNSYINWGTALAQQGEYDEAIKKYEKALNIDSSLSKIINDLMFTVRELKKTKQKHT